MSRLWRGEDCATIDLDAVVAIIDNGDRMDVYLSGGHRLVRFDCEQFRRAYSARVDDLERSRERAGVLHEQGVIEHLRSQRAHLEGLNDLRELIALIYEDQPTETTNGEA